MAENLNTNRLIKTPEDLITSREQTRAGFIGMALEKNFLAVPYIEEAKALRALAKKVSDPIDLLNLQDVNISKTTFFKRIPYGVRFCRLQILSA
jgi:type II restriction enzyme